MPDWVYDDCVGHKQEEETDQGQEAAVSNDQELQNVGVLAGKFDHKGKITEEAVHSIGTTEGQIQHESHLTRWVYKSNCVRG